MQGDGRGTVQWRAHREGVHAAESAGPRSRTSCIRPNFPRWTAIAPSRTGRSSRSRGRIERNGVKGSCGSQTAAERWERPRDDRSRGGISVNLKQGCIDLRPPPRRPYIDAPGGPCWAPAATRSEEHTSELQSQFHLVCRLLLEK